MDAAVLSMRSSVDTLFRMDSTAACWAGREVGIANAGSLPPSRPERSCQAAQEAHLPKRLMPGDLTPRLHGGSRGKGSESLNLRRERMHATSPELRPTPQKRADE
eukprot:364597-Chlamydomonas_euryale.AAC.15